MKARPVIGYSAISGLCLIANNAILIGMDHIGSPVPLSVLASYLVVVLLGYGLHSVVSFQQPLALSAFARYAGVMALNIPLAIAALYIWRTMAGFPMRYAAPAATACTIFVNFLLSRWAILGDRGSRRTSWTSH